MRVYFFGLFLRRTSLWESWPKLVRLIFLVFDLIQFYQFYRFYVSLGDNWCCLICCTFRLHTCSCILCSRHSFQYLLMTWIYRYTCAYPCMPLGIRHTTRWGVLTPLTPYVQILELVDSPSCWLEWRSESVDHRQTVWGPILLDPLLGSRTFLL